MEYKNTNDSFKEFYKSGTSDSTATAQSAGDGTAYRMPKRSEILFRSAGTVSSGSEQTVSGSSVSTGYSDKSDAELVEEFMGISLWDMPVTAQKMTSLERINMFDAAMKHVLRDKEYSSFGKFLDHIEKLFLLSPDTAIHVAVKLMADTVSHINTDDPDLKRMLDTHKGTLGRQGSSLIAKVLQDMQEKIDGRIAVDEMMKRLKIARGELDQVLTYCRKLIERAEHVQSVSGWQYQTEKEMREHILDAAKLVGQYYGIIAKEIERARTNLKEAITNIESLQGSKPRPENPVLTELKKESPYQIRQDVAAGKLSRTEIDERRKLAGEAVSSADPDMFEKHLLLGADVWEIAKVLPGMQSFFRKRAPSGWLGEQITALQEMANKVPAVGSLGGIFGGLVVIALFVGLAALIFLHPSVAAFISEAALIVLAIGMIVCFVVGLAGGLIGGVLAALAWAGATYLLNKVVAIDVVLHILVCILALAPSLLGVGWIAGSTPSAIRADKAKREKHLIDCRRKKEELLEYINDVLFCLNGHANSEAGQEAQRYYKSAADKIRRISAN